MTMLLGHSHDTKAAVTVNPADLTTHAVVLGRTGSGKTGTIVSIVEEAALSGASVIVLDPKGDLTNLALSFPSLQAEDFAPWVEAGSDPAAAAAAARNGIGDLLPNLHRWATGVTVNIYAPGKTHGGGESVNVLSSLARPTNVTHPQHLREAANSVVAAILSAIGCGNGDPLTDPSNVFLSNLLSKAWALNKKFDLEDWIQALNAPPSDFQKIDGVALEDFFPKKSRMKVVRALIGFRNQASKWLTGRPLDVASLVSSVKPCVSVFTLRHLPEDEKRFFSSILLTSLVNYMYQAPASNALRLLVVLDEARGYLPPYPFNPPTKRPICTLLAQGRAHGIGVVVGTQNPNDIDYKALTNVGTWMLGNLRPRDCARDLKQELSDRGVDAHTLSNMPQRHFLILKRNGESSITKIRWTYSFLRGPLSGEDLSLLSEKRQLGINGLFDAREFSGAKEFDIKFRLISAEPSSATVTIEHSTNGSDWRPCSLSGCYERYASAPGGRTHSLKWMVNRDSRDGTRGVLRIVVNGKVSSSTAYFTATKASLISSLIG